jgi:hypothetical protein
VQSASAINIQLNYTYDTNNFFLNAQAKAALEAAASFYSTILTDTFDAIVVPQDYQSSVQGAGKVSWSWQEHFPNPSNNAGPNIVVSHPPAGVIGSDQYIVYVGGSSLPAGTAGQGGPGGYARPAPTLTGTNQFTAQDNTNITNITNNFDLLLAWRGETPNTFARWGGAITFDNDGSTPWHFNHLTAPVGNFTDFYSIALHELGHTLGLGASAEWNAFVDAPNVRFVGNNAMGQNGNQPVPLASASDLGHWVNGKQSVIYGTSTAQEAVMDPSLQNGTRKKLTELDAAALKDIGWTLGPAPGVDGDYNNNGIVDAADYVVWRKRLNQDVTLPNDTTPGTVRQIDYGVWRTNYGKGVAGSGAGGALFVGGEVPEPAGCVLAAMAAIVSCSVRRRRAL